jgi:hypothetical protein
VPSSGGVDYDDKEGPGGTLTRSWASDHLAELNVASMLSYFIGLLLDRWERLLMVV